MNLKNILIEIQEWENDKHLADLLGITYDELTELHYEINTEESEDGLIYNYMVEFDTDNSPKHILEKIKNLENGRQVYLEPWELYQDYDYKEQYEAIIKNKEYLQKFRDELSYLKSLNSLVVPDKKLKNILTRQLYISVIGTMETFLSDAFINLTSEKDEFFRNFIETHPEFKKQKFELREIFEKYDKLRETAKVVMLDTIYHNLPTVSQMFKDTFKIEFPSIKDVYECVLKRHDLVHRNGKTKEGTSIELDENTVNELIEKISKFIKEIANKLDVK